VRHSLIAKLISFFLIYPISINSALSQNIDNQSLGDQLEEILNQEKYDLLKGLFLEKSFTQFEKQYLDFSKRYKDTKWSIKTISNHPNKIFLDLKITSRREIGNQFYNLNSKQTVQLETYKNKITSFKVLNEESILNSQESPLIINIVAPDKVLTGERYEINLIIETPLDNSLIAGGMIVLNKKNDVKISNDLFGIKLNQSGGLFKYIQAPLDPGFQTVSAIITHPKGIYAITKKIKVGL